MKPVEEKRVALHLKMRNFERDGALGAEVYAAENGRHTAGSYEVFNAVMIEKVTGMQFVNHRRGSVFPLRKV
jgi:hypothetical protein